MCMMIMLKNLLLIFLALTKIKFQLNLLSGTEIIDKYRKNNSKTERIVGKTIEPETGEEIKTNNVIQKKKKKEWRTGEKER